MNDDWEMRVQNMAKAFPYPPTPDIATPLRQRRRVRLSRLAQMAAVLLIVLLGLLAVPEIRAQVIAFFRIGAVEVVVTTATPPARFAPGDTLPDSVLDFPGATTLEDAQQHAGYPIPLPSALGAPDRVYLIQASQPIVVLAWLDADGAVDTSLHLLPEGTYSTKIMGGVPEQTQVNGTQALWITDAHLYILQTGSGDSGVKIRQVTMNALVWATADGKMTYRLETKRTLDEALRIAESIPEPTATGNG